MNNKSNVDYRLLIIAYNEVGNIKRLIPQIYCQLKGNFGILVVDDGSTDNTKNLLEAYKKKFKKFDFISYNKNRGKSYALNCALVGINEEKIIMIDGDMQDDLNDIPIIVDLLDKYELVTTLRTKRQDSILFKIIPSIAANLLFRLLLKVDVGDFNCSMKGFKLKEDIKNLYFEKGLHRFLVYFLIKKYNYSYTEIKTNHKRRKWGESKYNSILKRTFSFVFWFYIIWFRRWNFDKPYIIENKFFYNILT